jgi:hypothetical protein
MKLAPATRSALAKLIRLLSSDVDGEALGAVRAPGRALRSAGADFHDLANIVETSSTAPSASDRPDHFDGDDGETELPWQSMVDVCTGELERFTFKEQQFLHTMQRWRGTPTEKQLNWLNALFERVRAAA